MKLYHWKPDDTFKNFGDDLNPWIWNQYIPNILDEDDSQVFIGIGTLLNYNLPKNTRKARFRIVFGSGVGYGNYVPELDDTYHVYCVRGPLSAQKLGIPDQLAVVDSAFLIRKLYDFGKRKKRYRCSFMPHFQNSCESWRAICQHLGWGYIDPAAPLEEVMVKIDETEILLTEAMHGAIVADAFRVAWLPIVTTPNILAFKWHDWCQSIGVEYYPHHIGRLFDFRQKNDLLDPLRQAKGWLRRREAASSLSKIAKQAQPTLSKEQTAKELTERLVEKLDCFKADFRSGKFS
ncbi:polysaccharide pyruvyl transferase family protein [Leptolyngbya iicbica]|uniref:Polysaccharide pyruvyl transferase family protein n=2 Tax=Cyanophyceae TaxID=3028117 RepID=A0A4Q7E288_9CYAN|nr:polysaccharide pyruvyl transferase family protein [Leptolyngbya sp. LK]RZM76530.1 polysaccharide pyruvyl transferase family protein [Leptolyngbya sp. LK]